MPEARNKSKIKEEEFTKLARELCAAGGEFYSRGWMFGTSGNLSAVVTRKPLRLAISASGKDKGNLSESDILEIDGKLKVIRGNKEPSAESELHLSIIREKGADAVFHTHSVWSTIISENYAKQGGIAIRGYEMLKGLRGISSHEHTEWVPIFENSQDMKRLATEVSDLLSRGPEIHGFLLRGHGMYTWGSNTKEAKRHTEVLEFLMEVVGRSQPGGNS